MPYTSNGAWEKQSRAKQNNWSSRLPSLQPNASTDAAKYKNSAFDLVHMTENRARSSQGFPYIMVVHMTENREWSSEKFPYISRS